MSRIRAVPAIGSTCRILITSLRAPVTSVGLPNCWACCWVVSPCLLSEPPRRPWRGPPPEGGGRGGQGACVALTPRVARVAVERRGGDQRDHHQPDHDEQDLLARRA